MFVLVVVEDKIKTQPDQFDRNSTEVLEESIEMKYANRILVDAGLCIGFYDFVEIGDPYIYPAEGASHQQVTFRLVVFRPFAGEILSGKVISSSKDGLKISMGFFMDILIPANLLQNPSVFDSFTNLWTWKYQEDDEIQDFVIDSGDEVRFRVRSINFTGVKSTAKGLQTLTTSETHVPLTNIPVSGGAADDDQPTLRRRRSSSIGLATEENIAPAMQVFGCINEDGLGATSWWG